MNTLMGLRGLDFVLLGGDSAFFRSVVVMDSVSLSINIQKVFKLDNRLLYNR